MEKPGLGYHGLRKKPKKPTIELAWDLNKFIRSINHQNISTISTKNIFNYRICNKSSIKSSFFVLSKFILSPLSTFFGVQDTRRSDSKTWHMTWILVIIVLRRLERFEGIKLLEKDPDQTRWVFVGVGFCCWENLVRNPSFSNPGPRFFHGFENDFRKNRRWFFQCCMVFCFLLFCLLKTSEDVTLDNLESGASNIFSKISSF